jgi:uncharacterized protein (DUF885 family)
MRRWLKILAVAVALVLAAAATFLVPTIWFKPWSIDHFYARVFLTFALKRPMMLSQMRILEPMGLTFHNDDLNDFSTEFALREARRLESELAVLRSYDRASMSPSQALSYDVLEWFMANAHEGARWMFHDYPVNQMSGIQSYLPDFMVNIHHVGGAADARDYVARVSKFGAAYDQIIESLRERELRGVVPPRFVIEKVLVQMRKMAAAPPEEDPLHARLAEKLKAVAGIEDSEREEILGRLRAEIAGTVRPAFGRLITELGRLKDVATADDGVWMLPDGDAYYAYRLRTFTTTRMSPGEVHELGLREVDRLRAEMRALLDRQGHASEALREAMTRLNHEERFLYPDTDPGKAAILADYQAIIDDVDGKLSGLFDVRPSVGVKVERVPEFQEADNAAAYYQQPALDGSRPGVFFVNLRKVSDVIRFRMRTLAYHEAIPGHHFQIAVQQGLRELPFFRRVIPFTAYVEGWALYAERLAAENGFQDDPYDRLGYLSDQMLRAVRLVVDTGIHARRWTREEAVRYMLDNTGMPETEAVAEVERYVVMPGQACAYMVGMLKILSLREKARERLGERFDIRQFHNVVLTNGAVPLEILERLVDDWIASRARAAA